MVQLWDRERIKKLVIMKDKGIFSPLYFLSVAHHITIKLAIKRPYVSLEYVTELMDLQLV